MFVTLYFTLQSAGNSILQVLGLEAAQVGSNVKAANQKGRHLSP